MIILALTIFSVLLLYLNHKNIKLIDMYKLKNEKLELLSDQYKEKIFEQSIYMVRIDKLIDKYSKLLNKCTGLTVSQEVYELRKPVNKMN